MKMLIARLVRESEGQDLIEYVLLGALIAVAVTGAMTAVAAAINTRFDAVNATFTSAS